MKKIIIKVFFALSAFLVIVPTSCTTNGGRVDINCKYPGAIVYEKHDLARIGCGIFYTIKYKGEILKNINVYDIDDGYNVGDTINKQCH